MMNSFTFPASTDPNPVPEGQLAAFIQACRQDLQTGLVDVYFNGQPSHSILFARGELVNVYSLGEPAIHLDTATWLEGFKSTSPVAALRSLALTPQGVRIIRMLIEQRGGTPFRSTSGIALDKQFAEWMEHPQPALVHIRWPGADALALLPGLGAPPRYTLFLSAEKILHSAGSLAAIYAWKEAPVSCSLYSSEQPTPAWNEYLLHHAFSGI